MNGASCFRWGWLGFFLSFSAVGATVSNCDEASLRAAIASDSVVIFNCDATIVLSNTLVITTDLVLDATGHTVVLDGSSAIRIFDVMSGARLHLINLSLANGRVIGTTGGTAQSGGPGHGGAVRVQNGTVTALNCRFTSNRGIGGDGGPGTDFLSPGAGGAGEGGAIFCAPGQVRLTNCIFNSNSATGGRGGAASPGPLFGGAGGGGQGGAICAGQSQISLVDCEFTSNQASPGTEGVGQWTGNYYGSWGGACFFASGTLAASNCAWQANAAGFAGGAFHNSAGTVTFDDCRFTRNSTSSGSPSQGGAIYSGGTLIIRGSLLESNSTAGRGGFILRSLVINGGDAEGGAICVGDGTAGITNCAFVRNEAHGGNAQFGFMPGPPMPGSAAGGALFNRASASVLNTTFAFNSAAAGVLDLSSSTPNSRAGRGGAIAHGGTLLTLRFCTIAWNNVSDRFTNSTGGGCYNSGSPIQLQSSIFSANSATDVPNNAAGSFVDLGSNLSSDSTPSLSSPGSANNVNPKLRGLGNYGGNTPVFGLLEDSPALDAALNPPAKDQRGVRRPQHARADIGAFEQAFLSIRRPSPGQVQVTYEGVPGSPYTLQFSWNLADWIDIETQAADINGAVAFSPLNALIPYVRFFRVQY